MPQQTTWLSRFFVWLEQGFWPTAKLIWLVRTLLIGPWWALRDPLRVLWACRAPALSVVIGGGLIAMTDQARDIVIASAIHESGFWSKVGLVVTMLMWASISWYWARITLNFTFALTPVDADNEEWTRLSQDQQRRRDAWRTILVDQMPRVIGAVAIFAVVWCFHSAAEIYGQAPDSTKELIFKGWANDFLMIGIGFYALVAARTPILTCIFGKEPLFKAADQPPNRVRETFVPGRAAYTRLREYANPVTAVFVVSSVVLSPVMFLWFVIDPIGISAKFGEPVRAVLFGLGTLVPIISVLALLSGRLRFPVFGAVIVWMAISGSLAGDNHDVRTLSAVAERQHIDQVFPAWWTANSATTKPFAPGVTAPPVIFVATAGGASRAAYWTAQVLGEIAGREPHFHDRLFLISGVSGGSLGAATFRAQVTAHRTTGGSVMTRATDASKAFLKADFLTPAMASGLFVELPLHVLPWARFDDRAAALEKAWEEAWAATFLANVKGAPSWESGFVATFVGKENDPPWPILMLNGTSVEKGKRIITSNVRLYTRPTSIPRDLSGRLNRYDAFDILAKDIRISTAVTMSARFPVISPTGGLRTNVQPRTLVPSGAAAHSEVATRITDGGLYENFGATTADEVLRYVVERRGDTQPDLSGRIRRPVWPIVIIISSDPSLDALDSTTATGRPSISDCPTISGIAKPRPLRQPGNNWPECPTDGQDRAAILIDPLLSLYTGRIARGEAAATSLLDRIIENRRIIRDNLSEEIRAANPNADSIAQDLMINEMRLRLATDGPADFFHFRQCRVVGRKSPTMSWHDSADAWAAMEAMKGMSGDDPCGNGAEFRRLCVRLRLLTGEAANKQDALAKCLQAGWPKPE